MGGPVKHVHISFAILNKCHTAAAGAIYSRGGRAEVGGPVELPEGKGLAGSEGLVLRLGADGNAYSLLLYTGENQPLEWNADSL